jgi:hypothetical protein
VKLLRVENDRHVFELGRQEMYLFVVVLRLYPVIPPAHQLLTKSSGTPDHSQQLLDEALAEQRKENKKLVENLLSDGKRFQQTAEGAEVHLTAGEIEWLLQVFNDVRVGHWILLGSPEKDPRWAKTADPANAEIAAHISAMELAGMFQMELLVGLRRRS